MFGLKKLLASCLLGLFSVFSSTLAVTVGATENNTAIIVSSSFADTCSWNFQCEEQEDNVYSCHSTDEVFGLPNSSLQHIPIGKIGTDVFSVGYISLQKDLAYLSEKEILYEGPGTFVYPFVSIIKIQV